MKCTECATDNIDGAKQCWSCGASFVEEPDRSAARWVPWAVLGAVVLVVLVLFISAGGGGGAGTGGAGATTGTVEATASASSAVTTGTQ